MKLNVYKGGDGDWYWRLVSRNGRVLADGAEGYTRKASAERAAASFRNSMQSDQEIPVKTVEGNGKLEERRLPPMTKSRKAASTKKTPAGKK
jgi:uncharacterized protein YegP (UPF0339 family)